MKIISSQKAKSLNLKRFYTGQPCIHGHLSQRYVRGGGCCKCMYQTNVDRYKEGYYKRLNLKLRLKVLTHLGGKCSECGFDDVRALQVDHVNGGGSKDRALFAGREGNEKYQILCANCNWIKKYVNGE